MGEGEENGARHGLASQMGQDEKAVEVGQEGVADAEGSFGSSHHLRTEGDGVLVNPVISVVISIGNRKKRRSFLSKMVFITLL